MRPSREYTIFNNVTPKAITSSTNASPSVVTATAHGFSTGDKVLIFDHATNTAINGIYELVKITNDTFSLIDINTRLPIAGNGVGSGGDVCAAPKIVFAQDFKDAIVTYITGGTSTHTTKVAISNGKLLEDSNQHGDTPNFGATVSKTNPYSFAQLVNLDDASTVNGSTGIVTSGTDIHRSYEVNINAAKYITLLPTSWTQGSITAKIKLFVKD